MNRYLTFFLWLVMLLPAGCFLPGSDFSAPPVPPGAAQPGLAVLADGRLLLSWQAAEKGEYHLQYAWYSGRWSEVQTVASGYDWFVNWADFPAVTVNGNRLFTFFLKKNNEEYLGYDIMYLLSEDGGTTWSGPRKLHSDTTATEHGFVSAVPYRDGFYVVWLDGRHLQGMEGNFYLMGTYVDASGPAKEEVIDDNTCTCCQTSLVVDGDELTVFYRDRSEAEIRDIFYARYQNGRWGAPQPLASDHWQIAGCPVNGPRAARHDSLLAVAWFTGAENRPLVKLKISADGGRTFGRAIIVEEREPIGRVDVQVDEKRVYVAYLKHLDQQGKAGLTLRVYDREGRLEKSEIIRSLSAGRQTGFPRIRLWSDYLVFAWTDAGAGTVETLEYPLRQGQAPLAQVVKP